MTTFRYFPWMEGPSALASRGPPPLAKKQIITIEARGVTTNSILHKRYSSKKGRCNTGTAVRE
jgi:hypothetical protein